MFIPLSILTDRLHVVLIRTFFKLMDSPLWCLKLDAVHNMLQVSVSSVRCKNKNKKPTSNSIVVSEYTVSFKCSKLCYRAEWYPRVLRHPLSSSSLKRPWGATNLTWVPLIHSSDTFDTSLNFKSDCSEKISVVQTYVRFNSSVQRTLQSPIWKTEQNTCASTLLEIHYLHSPKLLVQGGRGRWRRGYSKFLTLMSPEWSCLQVCASPVSPLF